MNIAARGFLPITEVLVERPKLAALTSLRFFAAAMIVLHHLRGGWGVPPLQGWNLDAGVSLFFILSGFILTYQYPSLTTWPERRRFWRKRIARIWPAHVAAIVLVILIVPGAMQEYPPQAMAAYFVTNLAMVQTWPPLGWTSHSINGPSWSISTEFAFYLAFPLLIIGFGRTWWWKLALSGAIIAALVWLCTVLAVPPQVPVTGWLNGISIFYFHPIVRIFEFIVGMTVALAWRRWGDRIALPAVVATVIEAGVIAWFFYNPMVGWLYERFPILQTPHAATVLFQSGGATILPGALLIFMLALGRGWISRAMSLPLLVELGAISYSIYLLHMPLLRAYAGHQHHFTGIGQGVTIVAYLSILLAMSWAVFKFIEEPARNLISHGTLGRPIAQTV